MDNSNRFRAASSSTTGGGSGAVFRHTQTDVDELGVGTAGEGGGLSGLGCSSEVWTQSYIVDSVDASTQPFCYDDDDDSCTVGTMTEEELKEKHANVGY